jgi:hypothetical protein
MVKIQGSFAKYHHQNPYSLLSVDEVPEALSRLSDEVGFDLSHGSVKRLDIAMDLFTEYPPDYYIHAMMGRPNMERFEAPHSVTWVNKRRVSSAYDKIDEIIEKQGWEIPEKWVGKNVMRYEMRILQRVGRVFGHDVKAATLEDIGFFDHMVNYLIQDYKTIQLHPKNPFLMRAKTITEMQEEASAAYFQSLGPQGIEAYLNSHKYDRPEQKSRLRKRILELLQKYPGEGNFLPTL